MYDSRIGRRWERDPVLKPWESPYAAFNNNPILYADPKGLEGEDPKVKKGDVIAKNEHASVDEVEIIIPKHEHDYKKPIASPDALAVKKPQVDLSRLRPYKSPPIPTYDNNADPTLFYQKELLSANNFNTVNNNWGWTDPREPGRLAFIDFNSASTNFKISGGGVTYDSEEGSISSKPGIKVGGEDEHDYQTLKHQSLKWIEYHKYKEDFVYVANGNFDFYQGGSLENPVIGSATTKTTHVSVIYTMQEVLFTYTLNVQKVQTDVFPGGFSNSYTRVDSNVSGVQAGYKKKGIGLSVKIQH